MGAFFHAVGVFFQHLAEVKWTALPENAPAPIEGGTGEEDGFAFLADTASVAMPHGVALELHGSSTDGELRGWTFADEGARLFTATTPPPPGREGRRPLALVRL